MRNRTLVRRKRTDVRNGRRSGEARPTSADAVAQIDGKGYLAPWAAGAKPVAKVGVVYSEDARTIDEDWVIACEA